MAELTFELHSPMTEEEWDLITDVDLDHTPSVVFHTKHGKDVEYVKVKHGRWIKINEKDEWYRFQLKCPICGEITLENAPYSNYCPNCGADMREAKDPYSADQTWAEYTLKE